MASSGAQLGATADSARARLLARQPGACGRRAARARRRRSRRRGVFFRLGRRAGRPNLAGAAPARPPPPSKKARGARSALNAAPPPQVGARARGAVAAHRERSARSPLGPRPRTGRPAAAAVVGARPPAPRGLSLSLSALSLRLGARSIGSRASLARPPRARRRARRPRGGATSHTCWTPSPRAQDRRVVVPGARTAARARRRDGLGAPRARSRSASSAAPYSSSPTRKLVEDELRVRHRGRGGSSSSRRTCSSSSRVASGVVFRARARGRAPVALSLAARERSPPATARGSKTLLPAGHARALVSSSTHRRCATPFLPHHLAREGVKNESTDARALPRGARGSV